MQLIYQGIYTKNISKKGSISNKNINQPIIPKKEKRQSGEIDEINQIRLENEKLKKEINKLTNKNKQVKDLL